MSQDVTDSLAESSRIGRQIYQGFNERRLDLWDEVVAPDVEIRSTVGSMPLSGIEALKGWAGQFLTAFRPRLDLVDELYGVGRAAIAVNLHWKHDAPFFGLEPTHRSGTSVEYFVLWITAGRVSKFWVADHTMDITMYLVRERGMHYPQNFAPEPIVRGEDPSQFA